MPITIKHNIIYRYFISLGNAFDLQKIFYFYDETVVMLIYLFSIMIILKWFVNCDGEEDLNSVSDGGS